MSDLGELLHRGDLDEIVREVDRRSARGDHDGVLAIRDACRRQVTERGRQLWGPAQYAEYRLALEAPAPVAAGVVRPGAARFALGPLTEVVAQHHDFAALADHLDDPVRPVVAQERVLRGEDLTRDPRAALDDMGLPGRLQPWEPDYPLPTYRAAERLDGQPPPVAAAPRPVRAGPGIATAGSPVGDDAARALAGLVSAWQQESTGQVGCVGVAGAADDAVAALSPAASQLVPLTLSEVMGRLAWAAASGGARGRRRGGAAGRAAAWGVAHVLTGLAFPAEPDELEFHLEELAWFAFDGDGDGTTGWRLRVAVGGDGWAAAIDAHDRRDGDDAGSHEPARHGSPSARSP